LSQRRAPLSPSQNVRKALDTTGAVHNAIRTNGAQQLIDAPSDASRLQSML
jgi:hypothetical protein